MRVCPTDGEPLVPEDDRRGVTALGFRGARATASPSALPSLADEEEPRPGFAFDEGLKTGSQVGEYQVTGKIGEGGMGIVYAGIHPVIGKKVAIKLLNLALSQDPMMVQRFVQEARAVNQIQHHNIVDIFAFGQLPNGRHYFVMEYLQGRSLKHRLQADPPVSYAEAFQILISVCDALAAAHNTGIIHRDLKPDNIYLVDGRPAEHLVKLLDFGIAKLLRRGDGEGSQTRTGAPIGTPFYMSPEQCRSKTIDARSDVYAMGVIVFEMFTGRLPFAGPDYIDTVNGHLMGTPPLPTDYVAGLPIDLESLILRCLEKDPDHRPANAGEIAEALRAVAAAAPAEATLPPRVHASAETVPQSPVRIATPRSQPSVSRPSTGARRRRSGQLVLVGGLALLFVAAGGIGIFWAARGRPAAEQTASTLAPMWLEVSSDPPGAHILIDGRARSELTPARLKLPRAAELAVRVEREGHKPHDEVVRVAADAPGGSLNARLEPLPAELRIHTNVKEATWKLDGAPAGTVSGALTLDKVAPGEHRVRVEARGFDPREEAITLAPAQVMSVDWTLNTARDKKRPSSALPDAPSTDFRAPK